MSHILSLSLLFILAASIHATEIPHANPRFKFTLPPGFQGEAIPRMQDDEFRPLLSYSREYKGDRLELFFAAMNQELPELEDNLAEERLKQMKMTLVQWKRHKIGYQWVDFGEGRGGITVLVPLERNALSMGMMGKIEHREEMERITLEVIASLDGPTSWKSDAERVAELYTLALKIGVVAALVGFLLYMTIREKRQPPPSIRKRPKPPAQSTQ